MMHQPPDHTPAGDAFVKLADLVATLRAPGGCPWDREQTRDSLAPFLVEETYEALDALRAGDANGLREELGDLLFQILFHADMSRDDGDFDIADVVTDIHTKMVRRHPHVFGDADIADAAEVSRRWDELKAQERREKAQDNGSGHEPEAPQSPLTGVPRSLPGLLRAHQVSQRAGRVGFDWDDAGPVWDKVEEELAELRAATASGDRAQTVAELGDVLFSLVNLGRKLGISAEDAVTGTTERFIRRFDHMVASVDAPLTTLTTEQWQHRWQQAKAAVG